jgi:hypothetical protein
MSDQKIGALLEIDPKTVWIHFQRHRRADYQNGRHPILTDEQLDQVVNFAIKQFSLRGPVTQLKARRSR